PPLHDALPIWIRCTTLTKFPDALSGGNNDCAAPVAGENEPIVPSTVESGYASTLIVTCCPTFIFVSCVSLKLATTHLSLTGTILNNDCPAETNCPGCKFTFPICPSIAAVMMV